MAPLPLKSGALQGVLVVDNPLNHRFESLHIVYDGINGQLPNLDLFNTAVSVASGQMGIGVSLQRMWKHNDSYKERLQTMLRGMVSQGLGHASGPHSSFIPYHIDAITLQAVGEGWQDEMAMGRCVEGTFRSLNNLLEHFHQSFFFYLLMQADRFVSIGTYLPSAMLVAVNFTIMAIALWIRSGRAPAPNIASTASEKHEKPDVDVIQKDGMLAIVPKQDLTIQERQLFLPVALVASIHFLGVVPLYIFNNTTRTVSRLLHATLFPCQELTTTADSSPNSHNFHTFQPPPPHSPCCSNLPLCPSDPAPPPPLSLLLPPPPRNVPRHPRHPKLLPRIPNRPAFYAHFLSRPALFILIQHRQRPPKPSEAQCRGQDTMECATTAT